MRLFFPLLLALACIPPSWAGDQNLLEAITAPRASRGTDPSDLRLSHFRLELTGPRKERVTAELVEDSLEWIRIDESILVPRAKMRLSLSPNDETEQTRVDYGGSTFAFTMGPHGSHAELWVSLFHDTPMRVMADKELLAEVRPLVVDTSTGLSMDPSCYPFKLELQGFTGQVATIGCDQEKEGSFGSERSIVVVRLISPGLAGEDRQSRIRFTEPSEAFIPYHRTDGTAARATVKAHFDPRFRRMRFWAGVGPYVLHVKEDGKDGRDSLAPSVSAYGSFFFDERFSFLLFDVAVWGQGVFNNFGFYIPTGLSKEFDRRVNIRVLLGFQGVSYSYGGAGNPLFTQILFPQGVEFTWLHAFNIKNINATAGLFLFPSGTNPYQNAWIRMGSAKVFGELNFINWEFDGRRSIMYGASIGFPLLAI